MLIIVAPDSFKGTATATLAASEIAAGVRETLPHASVAVLPFADGGEGTAQALANSALTSGNNVETITLPTVDAVGRLSQASYFLNTTEHTAYIDVAAASGLPAVQECPDPLNADTFGTGVLIADAQAKGAKHIILGLGGSATIDGGSGILAALGAAAHDSRGYALTRGGAPLVQLDSFDTAQLNMKAAMLDFTLLSDTAVTPARATLVYGEQKGARGEQLALLTGAMLRLCEVTGIDADREFFGAAGCIPVGVSYLSNLLWGDESHARVLPGATYLAQETGLSELLAQADLIITGEGQLDSQSFTGKAVGTIAEMAAEAGVPLGIVAGKIADSRLSQEASVLSAELSQTGPIAQQLRQGGREIALQFHSRNS